MDNLNNIPTSGNWGDAASRLNDNFNKVKQAVTTVENASQNNKGYFSSLSDLNTAFPSPKTGQTAYVYGEMSSTKYYIYDAVNGAWVTSSVEAPSVGVNIAEYTKSGGSSKTTKEIEDGVAQLAVETFGSAITDFERQTITPLSSNATKASWDSDLGKFISSQSRLIYDPRVYVAGGEVLELEIAPSYRAIVWEFKYSPLDTPILTGYTKSDLNAYHAYETGKRTITLKPTTKRIFLQIYNYANSSTISEAEVNSAILLLKMPVASSLIDKTPKKINDIELSNIKNAVYLGERQSIAINEFLIERKTVSASQGFNYIDSTTRCAFVINNVVGVGEDLLINVPVGFKIAVDEFYYFPVNNLPSSIQPNTWTAITDFKEGFISHKLNTATKRIVLRIAKTNNTTITTNEALSVLQSSAIRCNIVNDLTANDALQHISRLPQNTTHYNYDGEPVRLKNRVSYKKHMDISPSQSTYNGQGAACFGDFFFNFFDTLHCVDIYNLRTKTFVDTVFITDPTPNARFHANTANFSNQYYDVNDEFPILYSHSGYTISTASTISYMWGWRVVRDENNKFTFTLVKTITFDFEVDRWTTPILDGNIMWLATGMKFYKIPLPELLEGDVTIDANYEHILEVIPYQWADLGYNSSHQGLIFHNNRIFGVSGVPSWGEDIYFFAFNLITKRWETIIDLSKINLTRGADNRWEPESLIIWNGNFHICYRTMIYTLYFD